MAQIPSPRDDTHLNEPPKTAGRAVRSIFGGCLVIIGLLCLAFLGVTGWLTFRNRSWTQAEATVTRSWSTSQVLHGTFYDSQRHINSNTATEYTGFIEFKFTADGKDQLATLSKPFIGDNGQSLQAFLNDNPVGSTHTIHYSPANPGQIALGITSNTEPVTLVLIGVTTQVFTVIGLFLILGGRSKRGADIPAGTFQPPLVELPREASGGRWQITPETMSQGTRGAVQAAPVYKVIRIIGGVLMAVGCLFLSGAAIEAYQSYQEHTAPAKWPTVDAQVTRSAIETTIFHSRHQLDTKVYTLRVAYQYSVGGKTFISSAPPSASTSNPQTIQVSLKDFAPGTHHMIWFNPAQPDDIRSEAGNTFETFSSSLIWAIGGGVQLIFGLLLWRAGKGIGITVQ